MFGLTALELAPTWFSFTVFVNIRSRFFSVNFGMGMVYALVMAYQFGTNARFFSELIQKSLTLILLPL